MNQIHDTLLEQYRNADFDHRLNLYLQFPALRSEFIMIDQDDLTAHLSEMSKSDGKGRGSLTRIIGRKVSRFMKALTWRS